MAIKTLVLCNDEVLTCRLSTTLSEFDMIVATVTVNGAALQKLSAERFDAVFIDCDGVLAATDLLELVRQTEHNAKSLVFAICKNFKTGQLANKAGANFVVDAPINWDLFKRTLKVAQNLIYRERRHELRGPLRTTAFLDAGAGPGAAVAVNDLSLRGMAVQCAQPLTVNRFLQVKVALPGTADWVEGKGRVAWMRNGQAGIEFVYLNESNDKKLTEWFAKNRPKRAMAARSGQ